MPKSAHLSVRITADEKAELERRAAAEDLSVGQLMRRLLRIADDRAVASSVSSKTRGSSRRRTVIGVSRRRELKWLADHADELSRHAGEWIILDGDELVAHGRDYFQVLEASRSAGVRIPFVERIDELPDVSRMGL